MTLQSIFSVTVASCRYPFVHVRQEKQIYPEPNKSLLIFTLQARILVEGTGGLKLGVPLFQLWIPIFKCYNWFPALDRL